MHATLTFSPIVAPRPVTLPVRRPDQDLVRLGQLLAKNWNPAPLTAAECLELLEVQRRVDSRLDALIRQEQAQRIADLAHDVATETHAFPTNPNLHDD